MTMTIRQLPIEEFVETGLLQEVNRQFFHPLGLALAVESEDGHPARLAYIIDCRDDPEGIVFNDFTPEQVARGRAVLAEQERRDASRRELLGFEIEPLPE